MGNVAISIDYKVYIIASIVEANDITSILSDTIAALKAISNSFRHVILEDFKSGLNEANVLVCLTVTRTLVTSLVDNIVGPTTAPMHFMIRGRTKILEGNKIRGNQKYTHPSKIVSRKIISCKSKNKVPF